MLYIFLFLLIFVTLANSPWLFATIPGRTDYYQSLSNPVMCIELIHQYPTGPFYLYSTFTYNRYSNSSNKQMQHKFIKYIFKKVNRRCETSVIFTTLGTDLKKLEIKIRMYLSRKMNYFAEFNYIFYQTFTPGIYTLTAIDNNFRMSVKVINESQNLLGIPETLEYNFYSYNKYIITKNHRLCVITENNQAVVLNINFGSNTTIGNIYGLKAEIFLYNEYIGERSYNAYLCYKDHKYPDIPTVFIIDGKQYTITFTTLYEEYLKEFKELMVDFELSEYKFIDVHKSRYVDTKYNKVFLIKINGNYKYCPDESKIFVYHSQDNTKYFVHATKKRKILSDVEFTGKIDRSVDDPCAIFKKK